MQHLTARPDRGAPLDWVQIGSVAGGTLPLDSALLRASRLQLHGSGIGSVPGRDFLAELGDPFCVLAFFLGRHALPTTATDPGSAPATCTSHSSTHCPGGITTPASMAASAILAARCRRAWRGGR